MARASWKGGGAKLVRGEAVGARLGGRGRAEGGAKVGAE